MSSIEPTIRSPPGRSRAMSISAAAMTAVTTLAQNPAQRAVTITRPTAARRMRSTRSGGMTRSWITTATATSATEMVTRP